MQRPKLTFIHGFMGHPSDWDEVRFKLQQGSRDFDCRSIEIEKSENWEQSVQQLAHRIQMPSVIIGYSMGARLALGIALEHPEKCDGLIFISGNPGLESAIDRRARWEADCRLAERMENETLDQFLNQWYQQSVFEYLPEEIRKSEIRRKLAHASNQWPKVLRSNSVANQPDYWSRLNELSMPVWLLAGQNDEKYRDIVSRFVEKTPVNVQCKIVSDCGHIVHREKPEVVANLIAEFVETFQTP